MTGGLSERTARLQTHTSERTRRNAIPTGIRVANPELSKRCSRMPLIGLVRLRRALEGVTPSFDPIAPVPPAEVGRHGNGARQAMAW